MNRLNLERWLKWMLAVATLMLLINVPVLAQRVQMEQASRNVQLVIDDADITALALMLGGGENVRQVKADIIERLIHPNPDNPQQQGINTLAVNEDTLKDLAKKGAMVLSAADFNRLLVAMDEPQEKDLLNGNATYVLFDTRDPVQTSMAKQWTPLIQARWPGFTSTLQVGTLSGVRINLGYDQIVENPAVPYFVPPAIGLDIPLYQSLQKQFPDLTILPRLTNKPEMTEEDQVAYLRKIREAFSPNVMVFAGSEVYGFNPAKNRIRPKIVEAMGEPVNGQMMGIGLIENFNQKGLDSLVKYRSSESQLPPLKVNSVRLHSISLAEMAADSVPVIVSRFMLAVQERNIRMLYIHTPSAPLEVKTIDQAERNLDKMTNVVGRTTANLEQAGYQVGTASPFDASIERFYPIGHLLAMVGGLMLATAVASRFSPVLGGSVFVLGALAVAGLKLLDKDGLAVSGMAFTTAIAAATLATQWLAARLTSPREHERIQMRSTRTGKIWKTVIGQFLVTSLVTVAAALLMAAIISQYNFSLKIDEFRGVRALYLLPSVLIAGYLMIRLRVVKHIFLSPLNVAILICFVVVSGVMIYLSTRSGNNAATLPFEEQFRSLLDRTLGVRPRTKEFLIGHPLFIATLYFYHRYRNKSTLFLLVGGVIGQMSMVSTFTHLHTPLIISLIRTGYGIGFGLLIGLAGTWLLDKLIGLWGLKRRRPSMNEHLAASEKRA